MTAARIAANTHPPTHLLTMLANYPLEDGEDTAPQINFTFFECGSGRYDAPGLAVSSSEDGVHVYLTTSDGAEYSVLLHPSDIYTLSIDAESLIRVCDDGSLWLSVQMRDEDGILEVLLSDGDIDRFFDCLEDALATSDDARYAALFNHPQDTTMTTGTQFDNQFDFNRCALHGQLSGVDVFVAVSTIGQDPNLDPKSPDDDDNLVAVVADRK